ncbi:MAG: RHS repeat-associated core domain-containing protein [Planctomycetaceae bacterium]|nr:RHS repeat-associated core domain-containing protein [Planctomycetaceae bacterium]
MRLQSRTYPDGRVVSVDYGTAGGVNDLISRVNALVDDDDTPLAEYQYLGLGAVVQQDSPEADLRFTLVNPAGTNDPDTGDIYSGLDRFGRVKDVRWREVSAASDLSRVQYGYDRASNRTFRRNPSDTANHHDWLYGYDGLHRLQDAQRGTLNGGHTAITSPEFAQCWTLDPTGNWQEFRQADSGDPWDLVQARLANPVNEITGITNSTGPAWAQPAYDGAGNMTTIPQPADPTEAYTATYDAWNRLVQLVDPATGHTVQENEYDGRGFRTVRKSYTAGVLTETRHFYYTDGWRDVEERLGTNPDTADPDRQFVWGLRYIDDLVLRDRSDAGTLDERLYACQDANWNVTAVVDDAGDVQERYEYDPYGNLTVLSPALSVRANSSFGWETTYAGYRFEDAIGLYAVRFRSYEPILGVWVQRDPLLFVDGSNLYAATFVPSTTDPFGLVSIRCECGRFVNSGGGPTTAGAWSPYTVNVNCPGNGDECCNSACGSSGGSSVGAGGWTIIGASPSVAGPSLCDRVPYSRLTGLDCIACCVYQNSPSANAQMGIAGAGIMCRPPLELHCRPLGEPWSPWRLHRTVPAYHSYRNVLVGSRMITATGTASTALRIAGPVGYGIVIAEGVYDAALIAACTCACSPNRPPAAPPPPRNPAFERHPVTGFPIYR